MLRVDSRIGSVELAGYLQSLHVPVEVCVLPFGDFEFLGLGLDGEPVSVGIERKALKDFVNSVRTGRLHAHQLPGMQQRYQQLWIVIEGIWRPDPKTGLVMVPCGKSWAPLEVGGQVMYRELSSMLITLRTCCGVQVERTGSKMETAWWVMNLYNWWTKKQLGAHKSYQKFQDFSDSVQLVQWDRDNPAHMVRLMAKELRGVGWEKSNEVALTFPTVRAMVQASEKQWREVVGIGKTLASRIVHVLTGTGNGAV